MKFAKRLPACWYRAWCIIGLALFVCLKAVKRITRPLSDLQKELDARTPDNLQPIHLEKPFWRWMR